MRRTSSAIADPVRNDDFFRRHFSDLALVNFLVGAITLHIDLGQDRSALAADSLERVAPAFLAEIRRLAQTRKQRTKLCAHRARRVHTAGDFLGNQQAGGLTSIGLLPGGLKRPLELPKSFAENRTGKSKTAGHHDDRSNRSDNKRSKDIPFRRMRTGENLGHCSAPQQVVSRATFWRKRWFQLEVRLLVPPRIGPGCVETQIVISVAPDETRLVDLGIKMRPTALTEAALARESHVARLDTD